MGDGPRHRGSPPAVSVAVAASLVAIALAGCFESIPPQRYGITSVEFRGVEAMDEQALAACLATRERSTFEINLGTTADPECGVPPFDASRVTLSLWRWPWSDWPLYDQSVFERDLARVERWYRARGYYEARVRAANVDPPQAREADRIREPSQAPCEDAQAGDEGCEVEIIIDVTEGRPVFVRRVEIEPADTPEARAGLTTALLAELGEVIGLAVGDRFDEHSYDQSKRDIEDALRELSYAKASIQGRVTIDAAARRADVLFTVDPGPPCVFGRVLVEGNDVLPARPIAGAANLERGQAYAQSAIGDAQRAIYALGAFSSVEVEPQIPESGNVVDVVVRVVPGRLTRFGVGLGIQSGLVRTGLTSDEQSSVNEWDIHALTFYENRNFLGGLRRFRIEERPRLIFPGPFPATASDTEQQSGQSIFSRRLGNRVSLEFRQPAFIEARTNLVFNATWDYGPDPLRRGFVRHDIDAWIGPQRTFLQDRLLLSFAVHGNYYQVDAREELGDPGSVPADYEVLFLEQFARLDLRDDPRAPRRGAYFALGIHEAGFFLPSSWDYIRVTPEARGYLPLPFLGMVIAARVAFGALFIVGSEFEGQINQSGPESDAWLGPERYRLRGGGASSNRGFVAGDLGDGILGGIRRWESSLELRVPITVNFGLVWFVDAGDVSRERIRFDHPQVSTGFGLRYMTLVGPIRLDVGYRVPGLQFLGDEDERRRDPTQQPFCADVLIGVSSERDCTGGGFPGAVHLTIGESF